MSNLPNSALVLRNHSHNYLSVGRALFILESHPVILGTFGSYDSQGIAEIIGLARPRLIILDLVKRSLISSPPQGKHYNPSSHNQTVPDWIFRAIREALSKSLLDHPTRTVLLWREDEPPKVEEGTFDSVLYGSACERLPELISAFNPSLKSIDIYNTLYELESEEIWEGAWELRNQSTLQNFFAEKEASSSSTFYQRAEKALAKYRRQSIFLSHSSADKKFARRLARFLQAKGFRVWVDEAEILVGDSLIEKIRAGIDEASYVVAMLSKNSVLSPWVQKELDIAMTQEIEGRRIRVLPVLLEDCELPGFLKGKVYADFRSQAGKVQAKRALLKALAR